MRMKIFTHENSQYIFGRSLAAMSVLIFLIENQKLKKCSVLRKKCGLTQN